MNIRYFTTKQMMDELNQGYKDLGYDLDKTFYTIDQLNKMNIRQLVYICNDFYNMNIQKTKKNNYINIILKMQEKDKDYFRDQKLNSLLDF